MKARIIFSFVLLLIIIPAVTFEELTYFFQLLMLSLSILATNELLNAFDKEKKVGLSIRILLSFAIIVLYIACLSDWLIFFKSTQNGIGLLYLRLNLLPALVIVFISVSSLMIFVNKINGYDIGKYLFAVLFSSISFSSITILKTAGIRYIVYLFLVTSLTDIFAYLGGTLLGKHKLCPQISPNKTWEGAICGIVLSTICGSLFGIYYTTWFSPSESGTILSFVMEPDFLSNELQIIIVIILTFILSMLSQIGDLVASKLKRTYEIKDFSNIIPGHGGILDRLDSALFAAMFLLGLFSFINYISIFLQ